MKGDVIVAFDNNPVESAADLSRHVRQTKPGSNVGFQFVRRNTYFDIRMQVGRKQYARAMSFSETEQFEDTAISPDSVTKVLNYLKQEISRLERRLDHSR